MLLQRNLEHPENLRLLGATRVHVGNIARSGVGAEALALILQKALPCLHDLDAIIIMAGASDAFRWLRAGAPPVTGGETRTVSMSNFFGWHPDGPYRWRVKQTALAEITRRLRQLLRHPVRRTTITGRRMHYAVSQRRNALEVRTTVQNLQIAANNFEYYFRKAVATAKNHAKRVIVARQPWLRQPKVDKERWENLWHGAVGDSFHQKVEVFYSTEVVCEVMSQIDARAEMVAREFGVESCEFHSAIEPSFDFFHDLFHFTPCGAAAVARVLADVVCRRIQ
jgi:lysophospholipase L1-like esterase